MYDEAIAQLEPAEKEVENDHSVLVIDDDTDQAEVLCHRLEQQGFQTFSANSGRDGLREACRVHPQLVLLDLRLPDIMGFDVCQQLADDPQTCSIPVIILSGMERPDIIRRARSSGCQYFVRKPYDPNALLVLIQSAIGEADKW